jgi:hypothetical protein
MGIPSSSLSQRVDAGPSVRQNPGRQVGQRDDSRDGALARRRICAHLAKGVEARVRILSKLTKGKD